MFHDKSIALITPLSLFFYVSANKVTGTVKWFNVKSGYGFINRLVGTLFQSYSYLSSIILFGAVYFLLGRLALLFMV